MKLSLLGAVSASLLTSLFLTSASAARIYTEFSGVLTEDIGLIPAELSSHFAVGDTFTGRYVYDPDLPGVPVPQTNDTTAYDGFDELSVNINGLSYFTDIAHAEVNNDENLGTVDSVHIRSGTWARDILFLDGPTVNGHVMLELTATFWDDTATAFDSSALINPASIFDAFSEKTVTFTFFQPDERRGRSFWGTINSVSYAVIPIPPSVWLFGSGLIGLVGVARRKAA